MKHLVILVALFLLVSCGSNTTKTIDNTKYYPIEDTFCDNINNVLYSLQVGDKLNKGYLECIIGVEKGVCQGEVYYYFYHSIQDEVFRSIELDSDFVVVEIIDFTQSLGW